MPTNSCVQEFPLAGDSHRSVIAPPRGDPQWRETCDIFRERNRLAGSASDLTARGISAIAGHYEREESRWPEWLAEHGVEEPRRGPKAKSRFHGIAKYLLGLGVGGDQSGMASVMAACLDAWLATRETVPVSDIPAWIAATPGGARAIYDEGRELPPDARAWNGKNDNVYTARTLAQRIVDHFRPHFRPGDTFLDPCKGGGAFFDCLLEPREWCEIAEGRDFLEWRQPVTWAITNSPWSAEVYRPIARHAYALADNVVFLLRWHTATSTYARHRDWLAAGHGWRETIFINWDDAGFIDKHGKEKSEGFLLGAFWWQRGWTGGMTSTYWVDGIPEKPRKVSRRHVANIVGKVNDDVEW
jgi:hypothetical protein